MNNAIELDGYGVRELEGDELSITGSDGWEFLLKWAIDHSDEIAHGIVEGWNSEK